MAIINSLLDNDFYKFTMGQLAFMLFPKVKVRYGFKNRTTTVKLSKYIDPNLIIEELEHVTTLKFQENEIDFLRKQGIFQDEYLEFLSNLKLSMPICEVIDDELKIEVSGYWCEEIYWEVMILSIVNELYYKCRYQDTNKFIENGTMRNFAKYQILSEQKDILFTDFGTRRRFSREWQYDVVRIMSSLDNFNGTSNVKLAMDLNIRPVGTNAHELYMVASGIFRDKLRESWTKIVDMWWDMYNEDLSIVLTDTYGTGHFYEDFGERAEYFMGVRHDSGCPFKFGDDIIEYYQKKNIDVSEKFIIFSDGLSIKKMIELRDYFKGKINIRFGWGTNLTNDMGAETLSIVIKALEVIEIDEKEVSIFLVKLSDNTNKFIGPEKEIELFKNTFNYTNTSSEKLIV